MADDPATASEASPSYRWDFFLSHSGADFNIARRFKEVLEPPAEVFLDREEIVDGEIWSDVLPKALKSSLVYVFLLSRNTDGSFYVGEEINVAVSLFQENRHTRRVVPIYLNEKEVPKPYDAPFGLGSIQGFALSDLSDLSSAGQRLRDTLLYVKPIEEKKIELISQGRAAVGKINGGSRREVLAGLNEATKVVRPLMYTLLALVALDVLAFVVCTVLLVFTWQALPAIGLLLLLLPLLLFALLRLTSYALGTTKQMTRGNIIGG